MRRPKTVDAYIATAPKESRTQLKQLCILIRAVAPKAEEKISYGMPYYGYQGRLAYFAGYQRHIGFYIMNGDKRLLGKELKKYQTSSATLRFPIGTKLPAALIRKIIKLRMRENEARQKSSRSKN